jgi:hypothetical protein
MNDLSSYDLKLFEVADLIDRTEGAIYKSIQRGTCDLPLVNVGSPGRGARYMSRKKDMADWLEKRKVSRSGGGVS